MNAYEDYLWEMEPKQEHQWEINADEFDPQSPVPLVTPDEDLFPVPVVAPRPSKRQKKIGSHELFAVFADTVRSSPASSLVAASSSSAVRVFATFSGPLVGRVSGDGEDDQARAKSLVQEAKALESFTRASKGRATLVWPFCPLGHTGRMLSLQPVARLPQPCATTGELQGAWQSWPGKFHQPCGTWRSLLTLLRHCAR